MNCLSDCLAFVTGQQWPRLPDDLPPGEDCLDWIEAELLRRGFGVEYGCRPGAHLYVVAFVESERPEGHAVVLRYGETVYDPDLPTPTPIAQERVFYTLGVD